MKFKLWLENQVPPVLYHHARKKNRQSILQNGLQTQYDSTIGSGNIGGIFMSNKAATGDHPAAGNSDIWEVDVRGLDVEEDSTTSVPPEYPEDEMWYVVYSDIPPNRLKLL